MFEGGHLGSLELRQEGSGKRFRGRFPYNAKAVLSDGGRNGGRPRKEVIRPGAFRYAIEAPDKDIRFLAGHRWDKPMASQRAGTLTFRDTDEALLFDAIITAEMLETSWVRDFMASFAAGLVVGLSPGFRLPPQRTVQNAEEVVEEDPKEGNAIIRYINEAILFEMSAVTQPAYPDAQIEARNWVPAQPGKPANLPLSHPLKRWRL